jgi:hypothetical protein
MLLKLEIWWQNWDSTAVITIIKRRKVTGPYDPHRNSPSKGSAS